MTQPVKLFSLQPTLDVPALACIRYPSWLKKLYNIAQMELTTLDPLGAFYLVARDVDWNVRPETQTQQGGIHPRPKLNTPPAYAGNAAGAVVSNYNLFMAVLKPNSEPDPTFMPPSWLALASPSNTPLIPNTPSFGTGKFSLSSTTRLGN
jgi:hypothetical protein